MTAAKSTPLSLSHALHAHRSRTRRRNRHSFDSPATNQPSELRASEIAARSDSLYTRGIKGPPGRVRKSHRDGIKAEGVELFDIAGRREEEKRLERRFNLMAQSVHPICCVCECDAVRDTEGLLGK